MLQALRVFLAWLSFLLTMLTAALDLFNPPMKYSLQFPHGTADTPAGRTIVVSIFGDYEDYTWDFDSDIDLNTKDKVNRYLKIAGDFIEDAAAAYDISSEFITDFYENPDLCYQVSLDYDMSDQYMRDDIVMKYIHKNIDTDALMEKYDADNLIFFYIMNTDYKNRSTTSTRDWYEGMKYPYEVVYLFTIDDVEANCPAVYAHEMLHTFGAPDLYQCDEYYGIDKKALQYIERNYPNEIMYTCSDRRSGKYHYDRITNEVSSITAYYIGLTDISDIVSELGLEESQHTSGN